MSTQPDNRIHRCQEHDGEWEPSQWASSHDLWREHRWEDHRDQRSLMNCPPNCQGTQNV